MSRSILTRAPSTRRESMSSLEEAHAKTSPLTADAMASIVFLENVANLLRKRGGRDFQTVLETLAGMGLDAEWGVFRACEAGLSHRRRRLFLLAHTGEGRRALNRQAYFDRRRFAPGHYVDRCDAQGNAPPGPRELVALRAWVAEHPGAQPGIRRDTARVPNRVAQIAALGDAAPPPLVALAWRVLRDRTIAR